ncbi:hypothetical protein L596_020189 [Steinernema carpocapsae]|uniref:Uncharacterized protein n=1 Tax=Steinernema carpocapsae TaxID=34508 RepID=A0A4U5MSS4_STECR|nr:hypothetical protein L596_020185 [Steinernema carpocapsae]TKR72787.1 hypothetical protein L596_020189 [Steinernema carpocapsae]
MRVNVNTLTQISVVLLHYLEEFDDFVHVALLDRREFVQEVDDALRLMVEVLHRFFVKERTFFDLLRVLRRLHVVFDHVHVVADPETESVKMLLVIQ